MNLIIKKDKVRTSGEAPTRYTDAGHQHQRGARLVSVAGVPRAIEVSCKCGENFVIELEFEEDPA
jgi:hypothetical protein